MSVFSGFLTHNVQGILGHVKKNYVFLPPWM